MIIHAHASERGNCSLCISDEVDFSGLTFILASTGGIGTVPFSVAYMSLHFSIAFNPV